MKKITKITTANTTTTLTTEQEEIEFRRKRGHKDPIEVKPLKLHPLPFDTFSVQSHTGIPYTVEIRSLNTPINSSSCPDFQVNRLGMCKHIEGVLHYLENTKSKYSKSNTKTDTDTAVDPSQIEIFLDRNNAIPKVSIAWPKSDLHHPVKTILERLFSVLNC